MRALPISMPIMALCIFTRGSYANSSSSSSSSSFDENINPSADVDEGNAGASSKGTRNGNNIPTSGDPSSLSPQSSSSSAKTGDNTTGNNIGNGHSTYYYSNNQPINAKYDDEQTYLDLFGERAKELLTQHIIPSTDAECQWDWRMGRCEPYCMCGFHFLWGDYHFGRSCRLRSSPPPSQSEKRLDVDNSKNEAGETSWQEAWQEVWQSQMPKGADDASDLVLPLFPKSPPAAGTETSSWDQTSTICALPPESRYIQMIRQLTNVFAHSAVVGEHVQTMKSATSSAVNLTMVHGQRHWTATRQKACETVKKKVEERAQIRNQPVVLTKQGATWIRRVCGTSDHADPGRVEGDQKDHSGGMDEDPDSADRVNVKEDK
ncbi:hypothetical protein ACHAWF_002057 [Thalassiosira exigua]